MKTNIQESDKECETREKSCRKIKKQRLLIPSNERTVDEIINNMRDALYDCHVVFDICRSCSKCFIGEDTEGVYCSGDLCHGDWYCKKCVKSHCGKPLDNNENYFCQICVSESSESEEEEEEDDDDQ